MSTPMKRTDEFMIPSAPKKARMEAFTYSELITFSPIAIEGEMYIVNKRGDAVNITLGFAGLYNHTTKKLDRDAPMPEDWDQICPGE
jgi:hypothetical protein